MGEENVPAIGRIGWVDLTVPDAAAVRDFYAEVVGWKPSPVPMGGYDDFAMAPPSGGPAVAGVCHARERNADLPAAWLVYITVADVDESARSCRELGGEVLKGPEVVAGYGRFCVIRDPAGAVAALFQPASGG